MFKRSKFIKTTTTSILLLFLTQIVPAQLKPGAQWLLIKTPHFEVITPKEALSKGQETANLLEYTYPSIGTSIHSTVKNWKVKINNQTALPNGFVTLAPRYSEFYTSQASYAYPNTGYEDDLLYSLAVHETRHMAQMDKLFTSFNKFWYFLGGEQLMMEMMFATVPGWYFEGDATSFETLHSTSGRGRSPEFALMYKARILAGKPLNYYQATLGSYVKPDAGDPYLNGYHLVSYMKKVYGDDVFGRIMDRKVRLGGQFFYGFRYGVRKSTGNSLLKIYKSSIDSSRQAFSNQVKSLDTTNAKILVSPRTSYCAQYVTPKWINDTIIAYGAARSDKVYTLEYVNLNGKVKRVISNMNLLSFDIHDSTFILSHFKYHPRFSNEYSDIFTCNLNTKKLTQLTHHLRMYNPVISPDGHRFAVYNLQDKGTTCIETYTLSGELKSKHIIPDHHFPSSLAWDSSSQEIFYIDNEPDGYSIVKLDITNDSCTYIIPPQPVKFSCLQSYKKWLLYVSPISGIDNIYAFNMDTKKHYQVSSRIYSATFPTVSPDGKNIAFVDFTGVHGDAIATIPFDTTAWKETDSITKSIVKFYNPATDSQPLHSYKLFLEQPKKDYPVSRYSPARNLFNIDTWVPGIAPFFFIDNSNLLGLSIHSHSIFSDWNWSLSAGYSPTEDIAYFLPSITCNKYRPLITLSGLYDRNSILKDTALFESNLAGDLNVEIPFYFQGVRSFKYIDFSADLSPQVDMNRSIRKIDNSFTLNTEYTLSMGYLVNAPAINITSSYGVTGSIVYNSNPYAKFSDNEGKEFMSTLRACVPGIAGEDNFLLKCGYHWSNNALTQKYDESFLPRGLSSDTLSTQRQLFGSLNYSMPLVHPDLAIGPLLYLKRISASVFVDGTLNLEDNVKFTDQIKKPQAFTGGIELLTDFVPGTIDVFPMSVGVRYSLGKDRTGELQDRCDFLFMTNFPNLWQGKTKKSNSNTVSTIKEYFGENLVNKRDIPNH